MAPCSDVVSRFLWDLGYSFCHQLSERSFTISGCQLPLCARDTGTGIGFMVVLLIYLLGRRYRFSVIFDRKILFYCVIGFVAFAFDAATSYIGLRDTNNWIRFFTGYLAGSSGGFMLLTVLSFAFFKGSRDAKVFDWKDILIALGALLLFSLALYTLNDSQILYYIFAITSIAGLLTLLFLGLFLASYLILEGKLKEKNLATVSLSLSIILGIALIVLLHYFHQATINLP